MYCNDLLHFFRLEDYDRNFNFGQVAFDPQAASYRMQVPDAKTYRDVTSSTMLPKVTEASVDIYLSPVDGCLSSGQKLYHGGETSIDIRRLAYASELSSVVIRRQNTQNTDLRSENPVTRYLNAFLRTSMGCISSRNIHTSIGIHFGHDAMDPICVIRVPVNVHAECVWAILRNLYKSEQYRKYVAYE